MSACLPSAPAQTADDPLTELPPAAVDHELRLLLSVFREMLPAEMSDQIERLVQQILSKQVALTTAQFLERVQGIAHSHLIMLRWAAYLGRLRLLAQGWQPNGATESKHRLRPLQRNLALRRPCFKTVIARRRR